MRTILLLGLVACGHDLYGGPASVRPALPHLPMDRIYSTYLMVPDGARTPAAVQQPRARCRDEAVCRATIVPADATTHWPELRVFGVNPGKTVVEVDFFHPGRQRHEHHALPVDIVDATPIARVALGAAVPSSPTVEHQIDGKRLARCALNVGYKDVLGAGRPDVRIYECEALVEVAPGDGRARSCDGMCPGDPELRYTLCVHGDGATVRSLTVLQRAADTSLDEKLVEGEPTAGVCVGRR